MSPILYKPLQDSQAHRIDNMRIMQAGKSMTCGPYNLACLVLKSDFLMRSRWLPHVFFSRNHVPNADLRVSINGGVPKLSMFKGFSIINHQFWALGYPIYGNLHVFSISILRVLLGETIWQTQ